MKNATTGTIEQTYELASDFVKEMVNGGFLVCLDGDLGAGKTTFTQGILKEFEAQGPYTSPTFNIIKEYDVNKYGIEKIYHIDAYRIGSDDMELIGWSDIIENDKALIVIEWPENVSEILPQNKFVISCEWVSENERKYNFNSVIARRHNEAIS
ncbi:MAG: tRNA (adenosine(37)-N6)-threonylcarbamoyltransferase complex ATPase subunit type 1 TsaE [Candidatus Moraniibacteriota bacterium]|jgi:tRNA threonylcarbamoyladenosine biosynthesis protein TsaE